MSHQFEFPGSDFIRYLSKNMTEHQGDEHPIRKVTIILEPGRAMRMYVETYAAPKFIGYLFSKTYRFMDWLTGVPDKC